MIAAALRAMLLCVGSSINTGDWRNGYYTGGLESATVEALNYQTDTFSLTGQSISSTRFSLGGFFDTANGFFSGGSNVVDIIQKINFDTITVSVAGDTLPIIRYRHGSTYSPNDGFTFGGSTTSSNSFDTIFGFSMSTEVSRTLTATLSAINRYLCGASFTDAGYVYGGQTGLNNVEKLIYATEARSSVGNLPSNRDQAESQASETNAYVFGGDVSGSISDVITRMNKSTETSSNIAETLTLAKREAASSNNRIKAVIAGGALASGTDSAADNFDFETETISVLSGALSTSRSFFFGI